MKLGAAHNCGDSRLTCIECSAQICPSCLVQCPVGNRCRACTAKFTTHLETVTVPILLKTAGASLLVGFLLSWALPVVGGMSFWSWIIAYVGGAFVGKLVHRVAAYKLSSKIMAVMCGGILVGVMTGPARAQLLGFVFAGEDVSNVRQHKAQDPQLEAAAAMARSRWPDFVGAFRTRAKGQVFSVKSPFKDGHTIEHMWVEVQEIKGNTVVGTLDNEPAVVKNYKSGQSVDVDTNDVEDWLYTNGSQQMGGFSLSAVRDLEELEAGGMPMSPWYAFGAWATLAAFMLGVVSPIMAVRIKK